MFRTMGFKRSKVIRSTSSFLGVEGQGNFRKKSSHHLISSIKGGGRYQGVSAAGKVMVACSLNCLLESRPVKDLQIPP